MTPSFCLFFLGLFLLASLPTMALEHHLTPSTNDTNVVADMDSKFVDLICPPSHPIWFVPRSSIAFQPIEGSQLRIRLEEKTRPFQRGFYICCPRTRALWSNNVVQRVQIPSCCPCCSWPEEEYCSTRLWNTSASLKALPCMQIFLFTGMVPRNETTLTLPWRSKVLIPCPAPLPTSKLKIYSQLPRIKPSRRLWFNTSMADIGEFNSRFGVCTTQQRIPSGYLQLSCEYPTSKRLIKPQAPLAPPALLPNVTCRLLPIGEEFTMNRITIPEFRVLGPRKLTVACTALYANIFIANRPPTLCFRWRSTIESPRLHSSTWSQHKCVATGQVEDTVTVAATNAYNFTTEGSCITVEVEIVERNRATVAQVFSMRLRVSPPSLENRMFVEVTQPTDFNSYNLFSDNSTRNYTLVVLNTSLDHLTLGFYALDEVTANTSCSSPTLGKEHFSLSRTTDRWLCDVILPAHTFNISLRQGNLETLVTVYPSPSALLPRSTVASLRGSVDVHINVTCPLVESDTKALFTTEPDRVRWLVYRGDELVNETYTHVPWLLIAPLINSTAVGVEPVLEWSSPSSSSLSEFISNLSTLSLPSVVDFSRRLCVSCETFFTLGGSSKSSRECVTLEAKEELREENLSVVETALRRFSSAFIPIQVSNISNPSFRITTAFPSDDLGKNGSISSLSVYAGSILELRCSMSRTSDSTPWPLIGFTAYDGNLSLPDGTLRLYALPFTLESRLRIHTSMVKTSDIGAYSCFTVNADVIHLFVNIVSSKVPEIVEPNQPVRYFTANELIRLTCRAIGGPGPIIVWRLVNRTREIETTVLKWCNESYLKEESSCSLVYVPLPLAENVTIECEAMNYLGNAVYTLNMIRVSTNSELAGSMLFSRLWKNYVFWIIVPLVVIVCFLVCLGTCLWRKSRQMVKAEKLIKMDNLIYERSDKLAADTMGLDPFYRELMCSLMPTKELRDRWCLDRRNLRPFSQPLGNGHYGTVQKAIYYGPREKDKKHADAFFVALKSPSAEIASLSCFRNEIAHLMKLSDGPNIVKMIGCAFGEKGDLGDTLLVLEFCPNTSLSDFIRRMLYPRGCYDNRPMYVRNTEGGITTGSTQVSTTPFPSSDSSVSQFVWDAYNTPIRVIRNDYEEADETPKLQGKRRRRGAGSSRRNTALVYQRLTRNSSSMFLQIATGISRGLEFLAENNVIHRDLATRNILMDAKYEPKICDFGLAVTVNSPQDCSSGTPQQSSTGCYHIITFAKQLPFRILPPEALSKQLFYLSSDIWEFGLLLWQMFFFETRKPFENVQSSDALLRFLSSGRRPSNGFLNYVNSDNTGDSCQAPPTIDRPPAIPDALWEVICDCLRFQASERPSASEVRQRLDECYSTYEENGDGWGVTEQGNNYYLLCKRVPSHENVCGSSSFVQDVFGEPGSHLATYENIERAHNSAGYLESFPSSSV
ncbi:Mast/stem cell growth factor receptor Kit [Echinococcus granulosus]|nr:Mast/stem cell growth factor receptor Kit [Echinococcus granulosus]